MPTLVVGMRIAAQPSPHAHDKRGHGTGLSGTKTHYSRKSAVSMMANAKIGNVHNVAKLASGKFVWQKTDCLPR